MIQSRPSSWPIPYSPKKFKAVSQQLDSVGCARRQELAPEEGLLELPAKINSRGCPNKRSNGCYWTSLGDWA